MPLDILLISSGAGSKATVSRVKSVSERHTYSIRKNITKEVRLRSHPGRSNTPTDGD
jgi:hypothetical protein